MKKSSFLIWSLIVLCGVPGKLPAVTIEEGITHPDLKKAWQWIKTDHPGEALRYLSGKTSEPSTAVYFHFIIGRAFEGLKKTGDALTEYRSAYFQAPSEKLRALAFLERAEAYYRFQNYYEAKIVFGLFLKNFSYSDQVQRANLGLAQSLAKIGYWKEALVFFEKAGEGPTAIFGRADALHRLGRLNEAHQVYQKGIAGYKPYFLNSPEHLFYYGENLFQMGNDQEALQLLTSNIGDPVFRKRADLVLGQMSLKNRQWEKAQKFFSAALASTEPLTRQEALYYLAETLATTGNKTQSRQIFQEYWSKFPAGKTYEEVLIRLSKMDLEEGRLEQADRWIKELGFRSSLKEKTLSEMEWYLLRLKEKDPSRMVSLWNFIGHKFLQPFREPFLMIVAAALRGRGKPHFELLQWLSKNGSEPVKINSLSDLVRLQIEAGNTVAALEGIRSLKGLKEAGDEVLRLEARVFYARMDYGTASERLLSLKKMDTGDLALLQDTLFSTRDIQKALTVFEKNLLRLGGNSEAYIKLADVYYDKGKRNEALRYYQKALEMDPLNEWALCRAGHLTGGEEGRKMLGRVKNENSLVGKFARAGSKEIEVQRKIGDLL
jgi:tetratricopeptide (TPR) repeat protein